jgi:Asp-tRNA(Asn)/Glu-tRNA(Gln) amidotransferase A subunit family amidase
MPAGLIDGLPVGLQLIAATGQEDLLLSIAREIEENQTSR